MPCFGSNEAFVAYGFAEACQHCNNYNFKHIFATYNFEEYVFLQETMFSSRKFDQLGAGEIRLLCPTCRHGSVLPSSAATKLVNQQTSDEEATRKREVASFLMQQIDLSPTKKYHSRLSFLEKRDYIKMLQQFELHELVIAIQHS